MFTVREMEKALNWLMGLYTPEDAGGIDVAELLELSGGEIEELCVGLRNNAENIYEYSFTSFEGVCFDYRGKELFTQRGIYIAGSEMYEEEDEEIDIVYRRELWLLEDMTFAIVRCVSNSFENEDTCFDTQYRTIEKRMEGREDIFIEPDFLVEELLTNCVPVWEGDATIYEL